VTNASRVTATGDDATTALSLAACRECGRVHTAPPAAPAALARCTRCGGIVRRWVDRRREAARAAALALAALALYVPAVSLPILEIEQLGRRSASSIARGVVDLLSHGEYLDGGVVLVFSIVFPLLKILLLIELGLLGVLRPRQRALTLRLAEKLGRWSMLDVLLLALMVMLVKLGDLVTFRFGPAVIAFAGCVILSMLAAGRVDPHALWEDSAQPRRSAPRAAAG